MKFRVVVIIVVLASVSTNESIPVGRFELGTTSEYKPDELRRDKRALTTICVEIKPSSPYEEPYYMCKGSDMPQFSKGGSSYGSQSSGYSSKPSYKPKPSGGYGESDSYHSGVKSDYHGPVKADYQQSKYDKPSGYSDYPAPSKKPTYSDHGSHTAYTSYDNPKPTYSAKPSYASHDVHSDYTKPVVHKPAYEKPSSHYESTYSSKPYGSETSEYSKPSVYDHGSSYESKPSYSDGSYSKPSYGGSGSSYSTPHESKPAYSKPSSYSASPTSYEQSDHYSQSKPSYSEPSHAKPYSKPTYDHPATSYSKPAYSSNEYSKPAKPYLSSDKGYGPASSKPAYSSHSSNYREMSEDMMQPTWDPHSQGVQDDDLGYRSMYTPMEYYNFETPRAMDQEQQQPYYTPLDSPMNMDFSTNEREAPTLQAAYPSSSYASAPAYGYDPYGPSHSPAAPYAPVAPSYGHAPASYAPVTPSYTPSYTPTPSYAPVYGPSYAYIPPCQQSYIHTLQPAIVSLPCFSPPTSYAQHGGYSQLGSPANANLGSPQQFYPTNINPLQDQNTARSDSNSESGKTPEDVSITTQPQENNKKPEIDTETNQETLKKPDGTSKPEKGEEKQAEKAKNSDIVAEKPKEQQNSAPASNGTESADAKAALQAMARMAKIAAQLKRDDPNKGNDAGSTGQGSDKPSGP